MVKIARILIILSGILPVVTTAQQPANYEPYGTFQDASELFDKEKYGAAQEKFTQFLQESDESSFKDERNNLRADAYFYRGLSNFHLLRNNAESQLHEFIDRYPTHARANEAWFYIGKLHFIKKQYEEALPPLENLNFSPLAKVQRDEARFMIGYCYFQQGRTADAARYFDQARKGEGDFAGQAAYYYSMIRYQQGRFSEALEGFEDIPDDSPLAKDIPVLKANCLLKLRRYEDLKKYSEEIEANSKRVPNELYLVLGHAAYEQKDDAGVVKNLEEFEKKRGRLDRAGHFRLGMSYYRGEDYKNAREHLEKVSTPEDTIAQTAYYYLGHSFLKIENYENARTAFRKASELTFDKRIAEESLFQYAKASFETHYLEDALSALQSFIADYPSSIYKDEATGMVGEILLYTNNYKDAIEYFETSGGLNTERARKSYQRACYLYGLELFEKRLYDKAKENFRTAFNQRKDPEITMMSYFWYAETEFRAGNFREAIRYYDSYKDQPYADKNEYYGQALYGIGWCWLKLQDYDRASKNFEKFLALADKKTEPSLITDASLRAADCELVEGRYRNAIRYYKQVRDYNNSHVDYALYRLGETYFRVGDNPSSISNYERLVNGYKKSEFRDDALNHLSDIFLTWQKDWPNTVKYAMMIVRDHPSSPYVPRALNRAGIAEVESNQNKKAENYFKTVALEHCYDREAALDALRFLSNIVSNSDYDRIYKQYKEKCPESGGSNSSDKEEKLLFSVLEDRYYGESYDSFMEKASEFLQKYPESENVVTIRYWRAKVLETQGKTDAALLEYEYLYKDGPMNEYTLEALNASADVQFERGNYLIALQLFTALEEKSDKLEDRLKAAFGKAASHYEMENYEEARNDYLSIYNDPNTTDYSRGRAHVQIAKCLYHLNRKDEAYEIFSKIEKEYENVFAAESQYMIAKVLYDRGEYEQSKNAAFYLKDQYPRQNYWKAMGYLVLAEDYLALGDTFQAVKGTLESLARQDRFPDISEMAMKRIQEIQIAQDKASGLPEEGEGEIEENGEGQ